LNNKIKIANNIIRKELKGNYVMDNNKKTNNNLKFKVAYAFAVVIALGIVMFAKASTEKNLGNIKSLEQEPVTITEERTTKIIEETVRQNLENVPDTRKETTETEESTEEDKYNTPYKDYYCLPFGNKIVKDFKGNNLVYSKTMGDWRTHAGIDFSGDEGGAVVAISYGEVISIYDDALYGTCVLIDHGNGVTAKYCGLNKETLNVEENSVVNTETVIGHLGTIPCEKAEGNHLHFEMTYNGEIVEPLELMGK
jgi:murein DD-endopeptidase MepM/ murein hydrolase activator NlpD